jgi:hypothetical protein
MLIERAFVLGRPGSLLDPAHDLAALGLRLGGMFGPW